MTLEYFEETLTTSLDMRPFQVFTIELLNGRRLEVDHPSVFAFRGGTASMLLPGSVPVIFDCTSVAAVIRTGASAAA